MSELISRQKLIEELMEESANWKRGYPYEDGVLGGLSIAIRYINSQPPADNWIPCSRELPPLDEEVLIHCEKDHYNVAYYDGSDFRAFDCLYDVEDVVHWKYFEPYKGVE